MEMRMNAPINGIGSSINYAMKFFVTAIELGYIYRPNGEGPRWVWAQTDPSLCTKGIPAVDCFFEELSPCWNDGANAAPNPEYVKVIEELGGQSDICGIAQRFQQSIQWVTSQYYAYLFRPKAPEMVDFIQKKLKLLDPPPGVAKSDWTTMSMHLRGGTHTKPTDHRIPLPLEHYIKVMDMYAARLEKQGRPLKAVYLTSDRSVENYISAEHMTKTYPRPFKYITLDHIDLGFGEAEFQLKKEGNAHVKKKISPKNFF